MQRCEVLSGRIKKLDYEKVNLKKNINAVDHLVVNGDYWFISYKNHMEIQGIYDLLLFK